jgi:hypothetical protein
MLSTTATGLVLAGAVLVWAAAGKDNRPATTLASASGASGEGRDAGGVDALVIVFMRGAFGL